MTKIKLDKDNRMLRIGFGKKNGEWFFRIDLWKVGFRFKRCIHHWVRINQYAIVTHDIYECGKCKKLKYTKL